MGAAVVVLAGGSVMLAGGPASAAPAHSAPAPGVFLPARAPVGAPTGKVGNVTKTYSENWSGYAQVVTTSTGPYTAVKDYWTVPTVNTTQSGDQYSSDWVGIDGFSNSDLVQCGTEADNIDGTAQYDAWTEILPASEVVLTNLAIHPGDHMEAVVKETKADVWKMTVYDLTTGDSGSKTVTYNSSDGGPAAQTSVEAVHERPEVNGSLAALTTTTNVTFDPGSWSNSAPGSTTTYYHLMHPASGATVYRMYMVNNADTAVIATPSYVDSDNDGFTVADGATAPPPPSS
ncbi:MAG: G1 family glutamic endopeptidase [Streptosporangiaceae bacterium]